MKKLMIGLAMITAVGCTHMATDSTGANPSSGVSGDMEAPAMVGPTPNVGYDRADVQGATVVDPEGDIAPPEPCKSNQVRREISGKIVCVIPGKNDPNDNFSNR